MEDDLGKIWAVLVLSMIKFIAGPIGGRSAGLHFITTVIVTITGMMSMVVVFTFFGGWIRKNLFSRFAKKRKRFTPRSRKFVKIWKKYGLQGVAFLTPVFLTPIGGTLLAVSSGSPREKILLYMLISAVGWAFVFTAVIYLGFDAFLNIIK